MLINVLFFLRMKWIASYKSEMSQNMKILKNWKPFLKQSFKFKYNMIQFIWQSVKDSTFPMEFIIKMYEFYTNVNIVTTIQFAGWFPLPAADPNKYIENINIFFGYSNWKRI